MNEEQCDIHDVTKAAADLVAYGCTVGATHFNDGITRLKFSAFISSSVNQIIRAVDEGLISAWEGVHQIKAEYEGLSSKVSFYAKNAIGIVAGTVQVEAGVRSIASTAGIGTPLDALLIAHGANNIYEGFGNIYNGPDAPDTVGPVRRIYQGIFSDESKGNIAYYSADLGLSVFGLTRMTRKPETFQLFRHDPINHERVYKQSSKLALFLRDWSTHSP